MLHKITYTLKRKNRCLECTYPLGDDRKFYWCPACYAALEAQGQLPSFTSGKATETTYHKKYAKGQCSRCNKQAYVATEEGHGKEAGDRYSCCRECLKKRRQDQAKRRGGYRRGPYGWTV